MPFFRLICGRPLLKELGALDVVHCTDDMDEVPLQIPTCPNGCVDSCFLVNLDLEGLRISFNLIANFIVHRDIGNWRLLGMASLDLLLPQPLGGPSSDQT